MDKYFRKIITIYHPLRAVGSSVCFIHYIYPFRLFNEMDLSTKVNKRNLTPDFAINVAPITRIKSGILLLRPATSLYS